MKARPRVKCHSAAFLQGFASGSSSSPSTFPAPHRYSRFSWFRNEKVSCPLSSYCPQPFLFPRILGSCTSLMQAIKVLVVASKDLQKEIVESGRVSSKQGSGVGSFPFPMCWTLLCCGLQRPPSRAELPLIGKFPRHWEVESS